MKQFFFVVLGLVLTSGTFAQSFTCDANAVQGDFGIAPNNLPDAYVSFPYSEKLTFKAPADAKKIPMVEDIIDSIFNVLPPGTIPNGATVNIALNEYKIEKIHGLPTDFTHQCNKTDCKYAGGEVGCVQITGTAQAGQENTYDLGVEMWVDVKIQVKYLGLEVYSKSFDTTFVVPGTYNFTIQAADKKPLAIGDQAYNSLELYPNPATNFITIGNMSEYSVLEIYDTNGRLLSSETLTNSDQQQIEIAHLTEGIYFVRMESPTKVQTHYFVKK